MHSVNVSGVPYVSKQKPSPFAFLLKSRKSSKHSLPVPTAASPGWQQGDRGICGRTVLADPTDWRSGGAGR